MTIRQNLWEERPLNLRDLERVRTLVDMLLERWKRRTRRYWGSQSITLVVLGVGTLFSLLLEIWSGWQLFALILIDLALTVAADALRTCLRPAAMERELLLHNSWDYSAAVMRALRGPGAMATWLAAGRTPGFITERHAVDALGLQLRVVAPAALAIALAAIGFAFSFDRGRAPAMHFDGGLWALIAADAAGRGIDTLRALRRVDGEAGPHPEFLPQAPFQAWVLVGTFAALLPAVPLFSLAGSFAGVFFTCYALTAVAGALWMQHRHDTAALDLAEFRKVPASHHPRVLAAAFGRRIID